VDLIRKDNIIPFLLHLVFSNIDYYVCPDSLLDRIVDVFLVSLFY
jgi:hypothetical protein